VTALLVNQSTQAAPFVLGKPPVQGVGISLFVQGMLGNMVSRLTIGYLEQSRSILTHVSSLISIAGSL
jgi:hypothetical protein